VCTAAELTLAEVTLDESTLEEACRVLKTHLPTVVSGLELGAGAECHQGLLMKAA
jgi:hypothetical protein